MTQDKYAYIYNKVKDALEKDKLFLRPELSLSLLSRVVGTNTVYLSKAINNGFGCSYSQLVNRYRINYLIEEAQRTGENIAMIAAKCNFWSRSTFFDVFRNYTGMTPHRYMEQNKSVTQHA
jgi:AraC-like DNA-binding protein